MNSFLEQPESFMASSDALLSASAAEGPAESAKKTSREPASIHPPPPPPGRPHFSNQRPTVAFDSEIFGSETSISAVAPDGFDAMAPETINSDFFPRDKPEPLTEVALVYDAQQLSLALQFASADVEIRSHIDARSLNFTSLPYLIREDTDCGADRGQILQGCGNTLYTIHTQSLRGNCEDPPTKDQAAEFNLSESAIASLNKVRRGQCVIIINKSAIMTTAGNTWFEDLYFVYESDTLVSGTVAAIASVTTTLIRGVGPNTFLNRVTFHALEGFLAAQAYAIPPHDPFLTEQLAGIGGQKTHVHNPRHSVLFKDCEFLGFEGDNPLVLITSDSYATFRNCTFKDIDITVEIFDVSFGGRVHLEDCRFENVLLRRSPPKLVSTSLNDELSCRAPNEDSFKYFADEDDPYDIIDYDNLAPNDISHSFYVASGTQSDCLRPLHRCEHLLGLEGPWPGCPPESVSKRRRNNHDACGLVRGVDFEYYELGGYTFYEEYYAEYSEYYGTYEAPSVGDPTGESEVDDDLYPFCEQYELVRNYSDPVSGDAIQQSYTQYGFLTSDSPWLKEIQQILPERVRSRNDTWSWPQVPENEASNASEVTEASTRGSRGSRSSISCSTACLSGLIASLVLVICAFSAVTFVYMWRHRRGKTISSLHPASLPQASSRGMNSVKPSTSSEEEFQTCTNEAYIEEHEGPAEADTTSKQYTDICSPGQGARRTSTERSAHVHEESACSEASDGRETFTFPKLDQSSSGITEQLGASGSALVQNSAAPEPTPNTLAAKSIGAPAPSVPSIDLMTVFRIQSPQTEIQLKRLCAQLDRFQREDLLLGQYEVLGPSNRVSGGQAVVQCVKRVSDNREFAVKFFLDESAFHTESSLYAHFVPSLRKQLPQISENPSIENVTIGNAVPTADQMLKSGALTEGNFLPHVESMHVANAEASDSFRSRREGLFDPTGNPLPACIVMERGESLHDWVARAEPDRLAAFWVLSNIAQRMQRMHDAGYVHMDLKPANVILLPRDNKWTVIDFGCAAKIGTHAPLTFSVTYCPPEVMKAAESNKKSIEVAAAMDVWALGVMAFELLTGAPAFRVITDGVKTVVAALKGEELLPWEGNQNEGVRTQLGCLRNVVLQMLHRDPTCRPDMQYLNQSIQRLHAL